jgi:hypothetical protein
MSSGLKKLTFDDMREMFPDMNSDEINWLIRVSESIRTGSHTHHQLCHMKSQSKKSGSQLQNAKAVIIDYYMTGKMTKNTSTPIPEEPKISSSDKDLTDIVVCKRYVQLFDNARERGIPFNLTIADVKRLIGKTKCHYTGLQFDHSNPDFRPSFDRIDKSKPYEKDNVVVCMTAINHLKNDLLEKEGALFLGKPDFLLKTIENICKTMEKKQ